MAQAAQDREIKPLNYIAYGLGDLYGGGSFFIISTFAMYFLDISIWNERNILH